MKELGPDARALIDLAAESDGPSAKDRARVRRAVMAAVGGGAGLGSLAAAGSAGAAAAKVTAGVGSAAGAGAAGAGAAVTASAGGLLASGALKISGWLLLGSALGVAVAVPAIQATGDADLPAVTATAATPGARGATAPQTAAKTAPEANRAQGESAGSASEPKTQTPSQNSVAESSPATANTHWSSSVPTAKLQPRGGAAPAALGPQKTTATPRKAHAAAAPKRPANSLSDESALLLEAQRKLSSGDPQQALSALDQHERRYPAGALSQERDAARVLALCAAGKVDQAHPLAAQFLTQHPNSPLARRVRSACAE